MLLDSNIIIYSIKPEREDLRLFIARHIPFVSAVSYVEVLGYHLLTDDDRTAFDEFFQVAPMLHISVPVLNEAVRLRQARRMALGDSLIAATAIVHQLTLVTHNTTDFEWIEELTVLDPLE